MARRADDQEGVALADVDGGDFEAAEVQARGRGIEDGEGDEQGGEDSGGEDPAAVGAESEGAEDDAEAGEREGDGRGPGRAQVGEGEVLDAVDREAHEVEEESGDGGGDEG